MMPKSFLHFIALIFMPVLAHGQVSAALTMGYGGVTMKALKDQQAADASAIADSLGVYPKAVYNFPSYWSAGGNLSYDLHGQTFGLTLRATATAGRINYSDYSGIIDITRKLSTMAIGVSYMRPIFKLGNVKFKGGMGVEYYSTGMTTDEHVQIYTDNYGLKQTTHSDSHQVTLNPALAVTLWSLPRTFAEVSSGYRVQVSTTKTPGINSPDWSGAYLQIMLGYKFTKP